MRSNNKKRKEGGGSSSKGDSEKEEEKMTAAAAAEGGDFESGCVMVGNKNAFTLSILSDMNLLARILSFLAVDDMWGCVLASRQV